MDVTRVLSICTILYLSGCSSGLWLRKEHEVCASKEIPLSSVPWISAEQQHAEAQRILPSYLRLRRQQEQDMSSLEVPLQSDYYD